MADPSDKLPDNVSGKYYVDSSCIDCDVCVPECPAEAIFAEDDVPDEFREFIALNAELAARWPVINRRQDPPTDADDWNGVEGKLQYLER